MALSKPRRGKEERCKAVGKYLEATWPQEHPSNPSARQQLLPCHWEGTSHGSAQWGAAPTPVNATLTKWAIQVLNLQFISRLLTLAILGLSCLPSFTLTQTFHPIPDNRATTQNEIGLGWCNSISITMWSWLIIETKSDPCGYFE